MENQTRDLHATTTLITVCMLQTIVIRPSWLYYHNLTVIPVVYFPIPDTDIIGLLILKKWSIFFYVGPSGSLLLSMYT